MKTIEEIIILIEKKHSDKVSESKKERETLLEKFNALKEIKEKKQKTKADIKKAMGIALCYRHLAFCCAMSRNCIFRDAVLDVIGWREKDFNQYKLGCIEKFWNELKK